MALGNQANQVSRRNNNKARFPRQVSRQAPLQQPAEDSRLPIHPELAAWSPSARVWTPCNRCSSRSPPSKSRELPSQLGTWCCPCQGRPVASGIGVQSREELPSNAASYLAMMVRIGATGQIAVLCGCTLKRWRPSVSAPLSTADATASIMVAKPTSRAFLLLLREYPYKITHVWSCGNTSS